MRRPVRVRLLLPSFRERDTHDDFDFSILLFRLELGVGYKNEVSRNPRCNSLNERGLFPEQFGTNFIAIGQKLSLR